MYWQWRRQLQEEAEEEEVEAPSSPCQTLEKEQHTKGMSKQPQPQQPL